MRNEKGALQSKDAFRRCFFLDVIENLVGSFLILNLIENIIVVSVLTENLIENLFAFPPTQPNTHRRTHHAGRDRGQHR
jgi:hypothetical protein